MLYRVSRLCYKHDVRPSVSVRLSVCLADCDNTYSTTKSGNRNMTRQDRSVSWLATCMIKPTQIACDPEFAQGRPKKRGVLHFGSNSASNSWRAALSQHMLSVLFSIIIPRRLADAWDRVISGICEFVRVWVCRMSICPRSKRKTARANNTKLGTRILYGRR